MSRDAFPIVQSVRLWLIAMLLGSLVCGSLRAQEKKTHTLTIDEVITLAKDYSAQSQLAKHQFRVAYWAYRTYRAEFLPSLRLVGDLPNFNRRLIQYQLPDGSYSYVRENSNVMSLGLSLEQLIPWTGTKLYLQSSLDRIDILGADRSTRYRTVPIQIGLRHNFFALNELRWKRKIEPKKYEEAKRIYLQTLEQIASEAVNLYFEQLIAQQQLKIAQMNKANADTLYKIAQGRYQIGTIAENDLLQMELNFLNADHAVNEGEVNLQMRKFKLITYLGLNDEMDYLLADPYVDEAGSLDYDVILKRAEENNPLMLSYERQRLQAQRDIAQAISNMGFEINLSLNYGFNQQATTFQQAYRDPIDQQGVRLSIGVPILDWGQGMGRVKMARSAFEMVETRVNQSREEFRQQVYLQIMRYNMLDAQMKLAKKADEIAQNRYRITKERFLIGKISVLDLDKAQVDRDNASNAYLRSKQLFWSTIFAIRQVSLCDPQSGEPLKVDFEELLK